MTRENLQVEIALLLSLLLHALVFGLYQQRAMLGRWPLFRPLAHWYWTTPPAQARAVSPAPAVTEPTITFVQTKEVEQPRTFMETDASQASGSPPQNARYYSNRATVAANPENPTGKTGETPYLKGTETRLMSTANVPLPAPAGGRPAKAVPASPVPAPAAARPARPAVAQATPLLPPATTLKPMPKEAPSQGLTAIKEQTKVALKEPPEGAPKAFGVTAAVSPTAAFRVRPAPSAPTLGSVPAAAPATPASAGGAGAASARELVAVRSRLTASGIDRRGVAAFNVAESPFGDYDRQLVLAVQSRWFRLIEQYELYERAGTVRIHFLLSEDGTVHDLQTAENSAGEICAGFCAKAIADSAPFAPLPEQLRVLVGHEPREVNFTFYY